MGAPVVGEEDLFQLWWLAGERLDGQAAQLLYESVHRSLDREANDTVVERDVPHPWHATQLLPTRGWPREPHFDAPDGTLLQARDGLDRDHPAVPHDRDAVRDVLDLVELVRREEHRSPGRGSLADKVEHVLLT